MKNHTPTNCNLEERDKFQEIYQLPKLKSEEIEKFEQIHNQEKGIESVVKDLPINKSPGPGGFLGGLCQTFKEELVTNQIQQYITRIIHLSEVGFIPGMPEWLNFHESISVMYHVRKRKDKNCIILPTDVEKACDKI